MFVQSFSVFFKYYLSTRHVTDLEGGQYLLGAPEEEEEEGQDRGVILVYNSCLEILLQITVSLQMQEHSVPVQL